MNKFLQGLKKFLLPIITSKEFRKKILNYSLFVLVASFFWFLNQLNREYKDQIRLPIVYQNFPDSNIQTLKLPQYIHLGVHTSGSELLKHYLSAEKTAFIVDLKQLKLKGFSGNIQYILINDVIASNNNDYMRKVDILSFQPDTVKFYFEQVVSKKVPIKADVQFKLDDNLITKSVSCEPDSISITGPKSKIEKINYIKTGKLNWGKLSLSKEKNIALKQINLVTLSENRVDIIVDIEGLTENKLSIPINNQLPLNYKLIPSEVSVSYKTGLSHFNEIGAEDFVISIESEEIFDSNTTRKVIIEKYPLNTIDIEYSPHFVDIIEIKDE